MHCAEKGVPCIWDSKWYKNKVASQWAVQHVAADGVLHLRCASRACCFPCAASNATTSPSHLPVEDAAPAADLGNGPPLWYNHPGYDAPGPAFDLLVGGTGYFAGLDSTGAAMFWRSKVAHTGAAAKVANKLHRFTLRMCNESLAHCILPPPDEHLSSKHIRLTQPSAADKGKGRADAVEEDEVVGKGKGRATPMDKDEKPPASSSDGEESEDTEGEGWGGF